MHADLGGGDGIAVAFCGLGNRQALDPDVLDAAIDAARRADLLVAIGTTLAVMPAAGLADMAKHLAIVNAAPTQYDAQADVVLHEPIGEVLPEVARTLGQP